MTNYLIRFDDICPTMNWNIWDRLESLFIAYRINPILAVIPDNQDPKLMIDMPHNDFWDRVRSWQSRGWSIAIHGFQHRYETKHPGIIPLNHQSEFAGLSRTIQKEKLVSALNIFRMENIIPESWIAPSHSFDRVTVDLLHELGVNVISDGLWNWPYKDNRNITWVPQQLWSKLRHMPEGVWTVCYHHNSWDDSVFEKFESTVKEFRKHVISLHDAVEMAKNRHLSVSDRLTAWNRLMINHRIKPTVSKILGMI